MLKRTINFTDFDGNEQSEVHYFNLTKADLVEIDAYAATKETSGLEQKINRILESRDGREIMETFKEIILKAYGLRSEDGKRFIRSEQISTEFSQTMAYDALFTEIVMDPEKASDFINGIMPTDLARKVAQLRKERGLDLEYKDVLPKRVPGEAESAASTDEVTRDGDVVTHKRLEEMTAEELREEMKRRNIDL